MPNMFEKIIELKGSQDGPTSIILAGVHGDERCGVEAFAKLLPNLRIKNGTVWFGYGNPRAIEKNVRFTEANLNRMFKPDSELNNEDKNSYEYQRAQFLKRCMNKADVLLDIHASFTPKAKPFVICEMNAKNIVKYLPFDLMITGFDDAEPGGTDYYMNKIGKVGICAECGYLEDPESTRKTEATILAFLRTRGHINGEGQVNKLSHIHIYQLYTTKTDKFILTKPFKDFEEIEEGQILGIDGESEIRAPKDGIILFATNCNNTNEEGFLLGVKMDSPA